MIHSKPLHRTFYLLIICLVSLHSLYGQGAQLKTSYEPNAAYPYGRPNPEAPKETLQYSFLIGTCECAVERFRYPDGKSISYKAVWTNSWTMNGWAIKDRVFSEYDAPISVRIYDDEAKKWKMTYFMPKPYYVGEWVGQKKGDNMVMEKEEPMGGKKALSRLTFSDITDNGFKWTSENIFEDGSIFIDWKFDCKKID